VIILARNSCHLFTTAISFPTPPRLNLLLFDRHRRCCEQIQQSSASAPQLLLRGTLSLVSETSLESSFATCALVSQPPSPTIFTNYLLPTTTRKPRINQHFAPIFKRTPSLPNPAASSSSRAQWPTSSQRMPLLGMFFQFPSYLPRVYLSRTGQWFALPSIMHNSSSSSLSIARWRGISRRS
jgi:hypothetical protein